MIASGGFLLKIAISGKPVRQQIKIHLMTVKLRTVNTGELGLARH